MQCFMSRVAARWLWKYAGNILSPSIGQFCGYNLIPLDSSTRIFIQQISLKFAILFNKSHRRLRKNNTRWLKLAATFRIWICQALGKLSRLVIYLSLKFFPWSRKNSNSKLKIWWDIIRVSISHSAWIKSSIRFSQDDVFEWRCLLSKR